MSYNPIDTAILAKALEEAGFQPITVGKEIVYRRAHHKEPRLMVKVYTSVKTGKATVKAKGKDAIRVCLVYTCPAGQVFGVTKAKRVFRTGTDAAIVTRMLDRMRDMYSSANKIAADKRCKHCGAPLYADSGKCVAYRSPVHKLPKPKKHNPKAQVVHATPADPELAAQQVALNEAVAKAQAQGKVA